MTSQTGLIIFLQDLYLQSSVLVSGTNIHPLIQFRNLGIILESHLPHFPSDPAHLQVQSILCLSPSSTPISVVQVQPLVILT